MQTLPVADAAQDWLERKEELQKIQDRRGKSEDTGKKGKVTQI